MASLAMFVIFLCFCYYGYPQNEKDNEEVKFKIEGLRKLVKQMKAEMKSLKKQGLHTYSLAKVEKQASTLTAYCPFLPGDICGECECVDDYEIKKRYYCDCQYLPPKRDCLEFLQVGYKRNGVYRINTGGTKPMQVYCDQETDNGGWTVFQRRVNGEINFYRNWQMYKHGFGTQREFWLGNDNIHVLTLQSSPKGSELRIDMTGWNDAEWYAKYTMFQVDNESKRYKLRVGGYSGNAGDSFSYHNLQRFSTYDRDNDITSYQHCSRDYHGAWWYRSCHQSNLNGEYVWFGQPQPGQSRGVIWSTLGGYEYLLKHVEMKTRRKI